MLDKLKTAVVLFVIATVAGLLIFLTNELTYDGIVANQLAREQAFYKEMFELDENMDITTLTVELDGVLAEELAIYDDQDTLLGYVYKGEDTNNYGDITVLIGVRTDGTIVQVIIAATTNTPTFVKKIETTYLAPFVDQDTSDVTYDERTGASYTYGSVQALVEAAAEYFQSERGGDAS